MPARRLVVAAASGAILLTTLVSSSAPAANRPNNRNDDARDQERTAAAERERRTATTEQERREAPRRTTTTEASRPATSEPTRRAERAPDADNEAVRPADTAETAPAAASIEAAPAAEPAAAAETAEVAPAEDTTTTSTTTAPVEENTATYAVVLKKGNGSVQVADEHARTRRIKVQKVYGWAVRGYAAQIPDDELEKLERDPRVAYIEREKPVEKFAQILPWGVEKVSRNGNDWSSTRPGDGSGSVNMDIYVVDTGIESLPDLNGGTVVNVRGGPNTDCDGHGTHMAGIAGAIDNDSGLVGVAPGVRVHGVKVLDCTGKGSDLNAVSGLDWVVRNGARPSVITMSFGGPISRVFDDAVKRAVEAGFAIITAAGNEHRDACRLSPAHNGELAGVITVGASTKNDRRAGFSNFGRCVDIYAPGVKIPSFYLGGQLALGTGTSDSAPHVAGVAALIKSVNNINPAALEAEIKSHAVRMGTGRQALLRASSADF